MDRTTLHLTHHAPSYPTPPQGVPSWWYTHVGTKVLIDGRGRGSLIMDPSFVEKRFFVRSKRYVFSHLTEAYQAGLRGNLLQVCRLS